MSEFLDDRMYDDDSWVKFEDDIAIVGIAMPSASKVEEFVFIKLPEKGTIKKGDEYVSLEAVKWSGHLPSPVSGEIVEVNDSLFSEPSKINKDPYGSWIMKVKVDTKDFGLMTAEEAKKHFKNE